MKYIFFILLSFISIYAADHEEREITLYCQNRFAGILKIKRTESIRDVIDRIERCECLNNGFKNLNFEVDYIYVFDFENNLDRKKLDPNSSVEESGLWDLKLCTYFTKPKILNVRLLNGYLLTIPFRYADFLGQLKDRIVKELIYKGFEIKVRSKLKVVFNDLIVEEITQNNYKCVNDLEGLWENPNIFLIIES